MPLKSKRQMRWMFANKPAMAERWARHTPDIKNLPESVGKMSAIEQTDDLPLIGRAGELLFGKREKMAENGFSVEEAARVARIKGVRVDPRKLAVGMNVEREHRALTHERALPTAQIALDHLRELPDYYERLKRVEKAEGQIYFGPRGGRWADPEHTIPYRESKRREAKQERPPDQPDDYGEDEPIKRGMDLAAVEDAIRDLPEEHACAFGPAGEQVLRATSYAPNFVQIEGKYALRMADTVFTHNHPAGGCLSLKDIWMAANTNCKEMRAVGKYGVFTMRRPEGGWGLRRTPGSYEAEESNASRQARLTDIASALQSAEDMALRSATRKMDKWMRDRGGNNAVVAGSSSPVYDEEVWRRFIREDQQVHFNEALSSDDTIGDPRLRGLGWHIDFEPRQEAKAADAGRAVPGRDRARPRRRADVRGGAGAPEAQVAAEPLIGKISECERCSSPMVGACCCDGNKRRIPMIGKAGYYDKTGAMNAGGPQYPYGTQTLPAYQDIYNVTPDRGAQRKLVREAQNRRRPALERSGLKFGFHGVPPAPVLRVDWGQYEPVRPKRMDRLTKLQTRPTVLPPLIFRRDPAQERERLRQPGRTHIVA